MIRVSLSMDVAADYNYVLSGELITAQGRESRGSDASSRRGTPLLPFDSHRRLYVGHHNLYRSYAQVCTRAYTS